MEVDRTKVLMTPQDGGASPYSGLPKSAYWRSGVAERAPLDPGDLYKPRFRMTRALKIMTAGSCFAQHVGRALRANGFDVIDEEPLPPDFSDDTAHAFGYRQYSARYGNIYTARQLEQLLSEAYGDVQPAFPVWEKKGEFYDAQRPGLEPFGQASPEMVLDLRQSHLAAVRRAVEQADVFVFTFGLTEAWVHGASGTVYPTAPGTIAGHYDPALFKFINYGVARVVEDFGKARRRLKLINPKMRFLLTVSPVPLTATASGQHVEVATAYSKATLRAACALIYRDFPDTDYFPSYEMITSQSAHAAYYRRDLREVSEQGVQTAMAAFMKAHNITRVEVAEPASQAVQCEDVLLQAFGS
jgi:hypothetical protein